MVATLRSWLIAALVAVAACAGWVASAAAQDLPSVSEQELKAAYLYKFLPYVEWPRDRFADPAAPLVIGVLGTRQLSDEVTQLTAGKTVGARTIVVRHLDEDRSLEDLHVLFVMSNAIEQLPALVPRARSRSVLIVTETPNALSRGSVINLVRAGDKIAFEVSLRSALSSRLRLSARLLDVAENVEDRP